MARPAALAHMQGHQNDEAHETIPISFMRGLIKGVNFACTEHSEQCSSQTKKYPSGPSPSSPMPGNHGPPLLCAVVPHVFSLLSFARSHSSQRCRRPNAATSAPCALRAAACGLRSRTAPVLHPQPSALDPPEGVGAEAAVGARGVGQRR